ncbi:2-succinyl-6-hydroxy-2,4-cyclohexadiene-1-carboxylate synthase [candidate division KSB1 bacterium]|nr:2-succinyl-6-hydroxy-2,4-cyclohexadiene-1-carboxylate synthase [candidate division KSB1 bacterium]
MNPPMLHHVRFAPSTSAPIVLLHGFLGDTRDWHDVVRQLKDFDFLAIDLPGHGRSRKIGLDYGFAQTARAIIDVLDINDISRCRLLGYSMGGRIALYTAMTYSARFSSLLLESCTAGVADRRRRRRFEAEWSRKLCMYDMADFVRQWYDMDMFASLRAHSRFAELLQRRSENDPIALSRVLLNLGSGNMPSLWRELRRLQMPVHYLFGEKDDKYAKIALEIEKQGATVSLYCIKDSGHNAHFENPVEFCNVLQSILTSKE